MYSPVWSSGLRQGDIVGPIPIPILGKKPQLVTTTGGFAASGTTSVDSMIVPAKERYAAVLSHDCEFNEGKRDHILISRIQGIDPRTSDDQLERIRRSNDVVARHADKESVDGVDNFLLDPIDGHLGGPHVIAFTTIVPYPNTAEMRLALLCAKRAELEHDQRLLLKRKLAWFFMRSDADVPSSEKRPKEEVLAEFVASQSGDAQ